MAAIFESGAVEISGTMGGTMKADIEKKINARVAAAFDDVVAGMTPKGRDRILAAAEQLVKTVWLGKIYSAMPADKTTVDEYFLDQELEQFLDEAVEESHKKIEAIAEKAKKLIVES